MFVYCPISAGGYYIVENLIKLAVKNEFLINETLFDCERDMKFSVDVWSRLVHPFYDEVMIYGKELTLDQMVLFLTAKQNEQNTIDH